VRGTCMQMLLIGNSCLTHAEEQTQMALWCISAAPLIMGNDLRNLSAASKVRSPLTYFTPHPAHQYTAVLKNP
jgi:hypothetical protein